jgi:hypothetical protein
MRTKKYLPIILDEPHWKLLNMYLVVLNYMALKCGRRRAGVARIVAGIVAKWLDICKEYIQTEYWRICLEVRREAMEGFFTYETLVAIHNASGPEGSELVLFGKKRTTGKRSRRAKQKNALRELQRAVRCTGGRPSSAVLRDVGGPISLRGGSGGPGARAGDGPTEELKSIVDGTELAGPRNPRLGKTKTQAHWWNAVRHLTGTDK